MVLLRHSRPSLIKDYCRWTQIGFARLCHKLTPCCSRTLLQGTHEFTWDRVDSKQPSTEAPFIKLFVINRDRYWRVVCRRLIQLRIKIGDANSPSPQPIPAKMRGARSTEIAAVLKIRGS